MERSKMDMYYSQPEHVAPIVDENGAHIGFFETYPTHYANLVVMHWDEADMPVVNFFAKYQSYTPAADTAKGWGLQGYTPRPVARIAMTPEAMLIAADRMRDMAAAIIEAKRLQAQQQSEEE